MFLLVPHSQAAERIDFNRDIRPLLSDNCFACHGPDANHREADLRLDQRDSLLDVERAIVISENPDESELLARIISDDPDVKMPPPGSGKELKAEEIQRIRDWIEQGAQWQEHWAFAPPMRSRIASSRMGAGSERFGTPIGTLSAIHGCFGTLVRSVLRTTNVMWPSIGTITHWKM